MTLFFVLNGSLHPPFIISGRNWVKIGGWFVLWRSGIYEIPLSGPISPLIVQESARLSPGDIEMIVILCGKTANCGYFSKIVPGLLCLGGWVFVKKCSVIQSGGAAWWMGTNQVAKPGESCPVVESGRRWCFVWYLCNNIITFDDSPIIVKSPRFPIVTYIG